MPAISLSRSNAFSKVPSTLRAREPAQPKPSDKADPSVNADQSSKSGLGSQPSDELDLSADTKRQTSDELTPEQQEQVDQLKARDREVRTHEQAHKAAAGPYARGGPTYDYQTGPDGKNYAIGGEVQIDTSAVPGDPDATIRKAQIVRAAALAPAEPSSQDRAIAAAATKLEQQAQIESKQQNQTGSIDASAARDSDHESTASDSFASFEQTDASRQNELIRSILEQQLAQQSPVVDFVA